MFIIEVIKTILNATFTSAKSQSDLIKVEPIKKQLENYEKRISPVSDFIYFYLDCFRNSNTLLFV